MREAYERYRLTFSHVKVEPDGTITEVEPSYQINKAMLIDESPTVKRMILEELFNQMMWEVLITRDKPVKIKWKKATDADYMCTHCPKCNFEILENYLNYCPWCGQAIEIALDEEEKR